MQGLLDDPLWAIKMDKRLNERKLICFNAVHGDASTCLPTSNADIKGELLEAIRNSVIELDLKDHPESILELMVERDIVTASFRSVRGSSSNTM